VTQTNYPIVVEIFTLRHVTENATVPNSAEMCHILDTF
jgi:hypothetical protein